MKLSEIVAMKDFWKRAGSFSLGTLKFILLVLVIATGVYLAIALMLYLMVGDFLPFGKVFTDAAKENSDAGRIVPLALSVITIISGIVGLCLLYLRLKNQEEQVKIQSEQVENQSRTLDHQMAKEVDDRFIAAVGLLGNPEASARTGAIYSLYQLFIDEGGKKYRRQIAQILCSHIRTKTQEPEYQKKHKDRPSNEIQTAINLLFRNIGGNEGIYCRKEIVEEDDFPFGNLQHAFLCGADFWFAHCERTIFSEAHCEKANFESAYCRGAWFDDAHCEGAGFQIAYCEKTDFEDAHCEGADFCGAHCEGARFYCSHCEGADFHHAHCEGADFQGANCEAANFSYMSAENTNFRDTKFKGSYALDVWEEYNSGAERIRERIGKDTVLESVIFDDAEGMITGVLEDSRKLQEIIQKLEELERRKANAPL